MLFQKAQQEALGHSEARGLLLVLTEYTHSFVLLNQYDTGDFPKGGLNEHVVDCINPHEAMQAIDRLRVQLMDQKEATVLFGNPKDDGFIGILGSIVQSFGGAYLYPSIEEQAAHLLYFIVKNHPFTDGIKTLNVVTDLKKAFESGGKQLVADFEKNITLAIVDEAWKKHLRKMDELKQSVQLAVHEQKDPLLIYKFEAYNLFSSMLNGVNKEVISFLFKGDLPQQSAPAIQEAKQVKVKENYKTSKDEIPNSDSLAAENLEAGQTQQRQVTETIVREMPKINRNDNVTIKHVMSGKTESMKYKKAESLLNSGEWVLVTE